jgi:hypothetical protein
MYRGGSPPRGGPGAPPGVRGRSLSPRSRSLQREMQELRERRAGEEGPDMDGGVGRPRGMGAMGAMGGPPKGGGWGGMGRGVLPPGAPAPGLVRRERPSMFDQRRRGGLS